MLIGFEKVENIIDFCFWHINSKYHIQRKKKKSKYHNSKSSRPKKDCNTNLTKVPILKFNTKYRAQDMLKLLYVSKLENHFHVNVACVLAMINSHTYTENIYIYIYIHTHLQIHW